MTFINSLQEWTQFDLVDLSGNRDKFKLEKQRDTERYQLKRTVEFCPDIS